MAKILVVDDRPVNRQVLVSILGYRGHNLVEASDGAEALAMARAEHPDLAIADILMPTMDGYEFLRQMRADPSIAQTPVIFCTADYLESEAQALAQRSGVAHVLQKPIDPEEVWKVVSAALDKGPLSSVGPPPEEFDREHLQLITNKLSAKADRLQRANEQLTALVELARVSSRERDPGALVEKYCAAAKEILRAEHASIHILNEGGEFERNCAAGLDAGAAARIFRSFESSGITDRRPARQCNPHGNPGKLGMSDDLPAIFSLLAAPIRPGGMRQGWLLSINKLDEPEFEEQDEELAVMLAAELGVAYEKAGLDQELRRRARDLEREVSERRHMAEALRESEERLRAILDHSPALIFMKSIESRYLLVNRAFEQTVGRPKEQIVGLTDQDLFPAEVEMRLRAHEAAALASALPIEQEEVIPDTGGPRTYLSIRFPLLDTALKPYALGAVCTDITGRKHAEKAVRLAEETRLRLASIVESSADAIIGSRLDGIITSWNDAATRIFGYSAEEMLGEHVSKLAPEHQADAASQILGRVGHNRRFEQYETVRRRKDGKDIIVSLTISPIRNPDGAIVGVAKIARDISDRKLMEQRLIRSQSLESLSLLAGGIAHNFNNLFMGIVANASLILDEAPPDSRVENLVENVMTEVERASQLTAQMLAYSGKGRFMIGPLSLAEQIERALPLLRSCIRGGVRLDTKLSPGLPDVVADAGQIQQLIINLAVNAAEAIELEGSVTITTSLLRLAEAMTSLAGPDLDPGDYVSLEVRDTGAGMDESVQARMFDPFFSTKFTGRGLGLAAVLGIVRGHKGGIRVSSRPGKGTNFEVLLPLTTIGR